MYQEDVEVRPFNLYMAGNLIHELKPLIKRMAEQCGQKLELHLSQLLQMDVEVQSSCEILQQHLKVSHDETHYRTFLTINGDNRQVAAFSAERQFSSACLDIFCGGEGRSINQGKTTEGPAKGEVQSLVKLTTTLITCFEEVYQGVVPIKLEMTSKSQDAELEFAQSTEAEYIISSVFRIDAGLASGTFCIDMPKSVIVNSGIGNRRQDKSEMESQLRKAMTQIPLPVTAIIGQQAFSLRRIQALKPGDIIPLGEPMDAEVFISHKLIGQARVRAENSRLKLQITAAGSTNTDAEDSSEEPVDDRRPRPRRRTRSSRVPSTPPHTPERERAELQEARPSRKRASVRDEK